MDENARCVGRESDVSSIRPTLGTHFLDIGDLGKFDKAMFHGIDWHSKKVFCILPCQNAIWEKVEKALF
jgi:hypothetical protein